MAYIETDGVRLYFEEAGQGPAIVFLHEFAAELQSWWSQVEYLKEDYRCIAFNARGYPPSDVPTTAGDYGEDRSVSDLVSIIDALALDTAYLVGTSMGASVALHAALRHPLKIRGLVLASIGSGSEVQRREAYVERMKSVAEILATRGVAEFASHIANGDSRAPMRRKKPDEWKAATERLAGLSAMGLIHTLEQIQLRRSSLLEYEQELRRLSVPTLLVAGDQDAAVMNTMQFLRRSIPGAGLKVYPWSGHTLNMEECDSFNLDVKSFFDAIESQEGKK